MRLIGGGEGTHGSKEGGGSKQDKEGRGKRLPLTRIVRGKTVTEKEKEKERATHDAATEGRRKRRKSRHRRSLSSSEEDDIKEEGEQGSPRSGDKDDGDSG